MDNSVQFKTSLLPSLTESVSDKTISPLVNLKNIASTRNKPGSNQEIEYIDTITNAAKTVTRLRVEKLARSKQEQVSKESFSL